MKVCVCVCLCELRMICVRVLVELFGRALYFCFDSSIFNGYPRRSFEYHQPVTLHFWWGCRSCSILFLSWKHVTKCLSNVKFGKIFFKIVDKKTYINPKELLSGLANTKRHSDHRRRSPLCLTSCLIYFVAAPSTHISHSDHCKLCMAWMFAEPIHISQGATDLLI